MSAKKLANIQNQPGISTFVGKQIGPNLEKGKNNKNSTGIKGTKKATTEANKKVKKHSKPGVKAQPPNTTGPRKRAQPDNNSPDNSEIQPSKRKSINMSSQNVNNKADSDGIILKPELQELKRQIFAGFEELIEPLKKDIQDLKSERQLEVETLSVETVTKRFERSDEKHKRLEERLSLIEDQLLEKNLIFQGIAESEYEDRDDVKVQVIKAIAKTMPGDDEEEKKKKAGKTSIDYVERIGRYNPLRARAVKVKFTDKNDVDMLLKNRKNLPKGVYVNQEYSKATEKEQCYLRPLLKAAKRMEKYKKKSRMEGPHLVLDGKHFYRGNLHTLPSELDPFEVTSRSNSNTIAFFGELNPFSNFHEARFTCEGEDFHCSEQYIQWKKAIFFNDTIVERRILNSTDALDSKEIARDIKNFDKEKWNENAEELCYEGIKQKYEQNPHLKEALIDTGCKTLVESCFDNIWGTGLPLSDQNCLTESKWKSKGILGRILMKIRESMQESTTEYDEDSADDEASMEAEENV